RSLGKTHSFTAVSEVTFRRMIRSEIEYYVDRCRPYDKAGAYGVQEWIGFAAITSIKGSYCNVVGLPVDMLAAELPSVCK
ncbi:MAG: Maf family protein, partial [Bacteroidales bacterium]